MATQIYNGKVLADNGTWLNEGSIVVSDGRIVEILDNSRKAEGVDRYIDAEGGFVVPGGIDLHVHGAAGHDFMDGTAEAFGKIIETHRRHGTTSIYPTISSASYETMRRAAEICAEMMRDVNSGVLGLHLEGPYFNPAMAGGQIAENIRLAQKEEYEALLADFDCIARWDAAPEMPGALEFGRYAKAKGVVPGIAHTQAGIDEVSAAYENGYTFATHFYNGMTGIHKEGIYKKSGTVEAVFLHDGIDVEVIADGVHVPPEVLRLVHKFKGSDRMCLVTDALAITGTDGLSDARVVVENGVCKLRDGSAIAGSCSTMDHLIKTAVDKAGISLEEVSKMVSETPARIMGVFDRKGSLSAGKDADILILSRSLALTHVLAMGNEIEI